MREVECQAFEAIEWCQTRGAESQKRLQKVCWKTSRGEVHEKDHQLWRQEVVEKKKDHGHRPGHHPQRDVQKPSALGKETECQLYRE